MVTFELIFSSSDFIRYNYYPEDNKDAVPGVIEIDINAETIDVIKPAEKDFLRRASASEMNSLRDAINEMRVEQGEPELTEEELPSADKDSEWYWYADHAIRKIVSAYNEGTILEKGMSMWY